VHNCSLTRGIAVKIENVIIGAHCISYLLRWRHRIIKIADTRKNRDVTQNRAPRPARDHVARTTWQPIGAYWRGRDRGIAYSRGAGKSRRGKASTFSTGWSWQVTLILSRIVVRDSHRSTGPVSVDRDIVEVTGDPWQFYELPTFPVCDRMKTFVHVLLVAACFVACARGFPSECNIVLLD